MKYFLVLIINSLLFFSCQNHSTNNIKTLNLIKEIEQLDGRYISDVRGLTNDENYIYISEYNLNQIFKISKNSLKLESVYGRYGEGPGELTGASEIYIENGMLYVENDFKRAIEKYNTSNKSHVKTIKLPNSLNDADFILNFLVKEGSCYISTVSSKSTSINTFDENGQITQKGGEVFTFDDNMSQFLIRNGRHLSMLGSDKIIAVSNNLPIIELYDLSLNIKNVYDYTNASELIQKNIEHINLKSNTDDENSYRILAKDISTYKNKLYILFSIYGDGFGFRQNKLIVFNIKENDIVFDNILALDENSIYNAITVDKNSIIAFNYTTSSIQIFSKYDHSP